MIDRAGWVFTGYLLLVFAFRAAPLPEARAEAGRPSSLGATGSTQPPAAPTLSGAADSTSQITWTWNTVPNALFYSLHDSFTGSAIPGAASLPGPPFSEAGLLENTPYTRYVVAHNDAGPSPPSNEFRRYTLVDEKSYVLVPGVKQIEVSVVPPPNATADQTGCQISRRIEGEPVGGLVKPWSAQYQFVDTGLDPQKTYCYSVDWRNGDGIVAPDVFSDLCARPKDEEQGDAFCTITADPHCAHEKGEIVSFFYVMVNASPNETKHFVVTHDMAGAFLFSLSPGQSQVLLVEVEVSVDTYRLHPKAWCKIFRQEELGAAIRLQLDVNFQVNEILRQLRPHSTLRRKIDKGEDQLIKAVESMDEEAIGAKKDELDSLDEQDNEILAKILEPQETINRLYGHPPEADAEILELNLVLFKPSELDLPVTVGPEDPPPSNPSPPDFKKKPQRIPDDQEDDPGVHLHVNNDNDDFDDLLDLDDQDVSVDGKPLEDDLVQFWWFYGRPIDGSDALRVETLSTKLKVWKKAHKTAEGETTHVVPDPFERDRYFLEATDASAARLAETVKASYMECEDKFQATAAKTEFLDKDKNPIDPKQKGLHVALLPYAFDLTVPPKLPFKDFIDGGADVKPEPDRFFVRITDPEQKGASIQAKIRSAVFFPKADQRIDPDGGDGNDFTLKAEGGGKYISKAMILCSDDKDDDFADPASTGSAKDDDPDDRTLKVRIGGAFPKAGGYVSVVYKNTKGKDHPAPIKVCDVVGETEKTFKVHFIVLRDKKGGKPVVDPAFPKDDLDVMKERYLQACATAELVRIDEVDPPEGVDLTKGTEEFFVVNNRFRWSDDQLAILDHVSDLNGIADPSKRDHVDVIFIHHFLDRNGKPAGTGGTTIAQELLHADYARYNQVAFVARKIRPGAPDEIDLYKPGTKRDERNGWVVAAHEVGHLFNLDDLNPPPGRFEVRTNLMYGGNVSTLNSIGAAKRLTKTHPFILTNQVEKIRANRPFIK